MSDDLISRRSILNKINEWSNKLSCENGKQFTLAEFEYIVANEPTAYDVDKVVEEIREYADNIAELGGNFLPEVVIKIVKQGGV